jgi:hypothetical protein
MTTDSDNLDLKPSEELRERLRRDVERRFGNLGSNHARPWFRIAVAAALILAFLGSYAFYSKMIKDNPQPGVPVMTLNDSNDPHESVHSDRFEPELPSRSLDK